MRKLFAVVVLSAFAAGCSGELTNDQIIAETRKCAAAGLDAAEMTNGLGEIVHVYCVPKERHP